MRKATFQWDEKKDKENQTRHGISFLTAQQAFLDPSRVIAEDVTHSTEKIGITAWGVSAKVF